MPTNEAAARSASPRFEPALADPHDSFDDNGENGGLQSEEQRAYDPDIPPERVDDAERHDRDDAGENEQPAGDKAAERCDA